MNHKHWSEWKPKDWAAATYCEKCNLPLIQPEGSEEKVCVYCTWTQQQEIAETFLVTALAFYSAPVNYVRQRQAILVEAYKGEGKISEVENDQGKTAEEALQYYWDVKKDTYAEKEDEGNDKIVHKDIADNVPNDGSNIDVGVSEAGPEISKSGILDHNRNGDNNNLVGGDQGNGRKGSK